MRVRTHHHIPGRPSFLDDLAEAERRDREQTRRVLRPDFSRGAQVENAAPRATQSSIASDYGMERRSVPSTTTDGRVDGGAAGAIGSGRHGDPSQLAAPPIGTLRHREPSSRMSSAPLLAETHRDDLRALRLWEREHGRVGASRREPRRMSLLSWALWLIAAAWLCVVADAIGRAW